MTKPQEKMTINNSDKIEESNDESCCSYFKGKFIIKEGGNIFVVPIPLIKVHFNQIYS